MQIPFLLYFMFNSELLSTYEDLINVSLVKNQKLKVLSEQSTDSMLDTNLVCCLLVFKCVRDRKNILDEVEGAMGQKGIKSSCSCDSECIVKRGEKQASGRMSTGSFSAMWSVCYPLHDQFRYCSNKAAVGRSFALCICFLSRCLFSSACCCSD